MQRNGKNTIGLVFPYFGAFKPSVKLFLEGVRRNPKIDWLIFTDNAAPENLPENAHWHKTDLKAVEKLAQEKTGLAVTLSRPYKLCDWKCFYGTVFADYLAGYEYFGYGDMDVVYGKVYEYLQSFHYQKYDKINRWGHLTLIKNTEEMNGLCFTEKAREIYDVAPALIDGNRNYGLDEVAHNDICFALGKSVYMGAFPADIDIFYERMRLVDRRTMTKICHVKNVTFAPKNYHKQLFALKKGRVVRLYIKGGKVRQEEYAYIHFRKEAPINFDDFARDTFLFSRSGFYPAEANDLTDPKKVKEYIRRYNSNGKPFVEWLEWTKLGKKILRLYAKMRGGAKKEER